MRRTLGFVLIVAGGILAWFDWRESGGTIESFVFRDIGEIWFKIDKESLILAQPAIERHVAEWLWNPVIQTVLETPAAPVALGLGVLLVLFGRRARRARYR